MAHPRFSSSCLAPPAYQTPPPDESVQYDMQLPTHYFMKLQRGFLRQALHDGVGISSFVRFLRKCVPNALTHISIIGSGRAMVPLLRPCVCHLLLASRGPTLLHQPPDVNMATREAGQS